MLALALAAALAAAPVPAHAGGRPVTEPGGALAFGWPGTYFEGRFIGTSVRVRLEAPRDQLRLLIDGEEKARLLDSARVDTTIAGLPAGEHLVRLEKLGETQAGASRFLGFSTDGSALPPKPRSMQIEFVGDSYTVGYGNTSATRTCTADELHRRTDTQQAFGPLLAARLGADYRIHAYSGFGIVRNYDGGEPALSLPAIYSRARPDGAGGAAPADLSWRPLWIVVNLGTNDFSTPLKPGERWSSEAELRSDYRRTYGAFLRSLSRRQPQARFVLMGGDDFIADVRAVAAEHNRQSPGRATVVHFGKLELTGCDWHPSLEDHRQLAAQLAQELIQERR